MASTSAYRRALLGRVYGSFRCVSPDIDEVRQEGESAEGMVARLSLAKARAVAERYPEAYVIGSDQAAVLLDDFQQESVLGKPGTAARCIDQLKGCSGKTVSYLTGVAVVRRSAGIEHEILDATRVTFRTLDVPTIERYVERESPLDCAGGFKSEGLGIALCASIDSDDPTALIGLPLIRLCETLRRVGFEIP